MLTRCAAATYGSKTQPLECDDPATCVLISPAGVRSPGRLCRFHGLFLVDRYNINSDCETWSLRSTIHA